MKFLAGALVLVGVALFLWTASHQFPGVPPEGAEKQAGFKPYKTYCARCHGLGGKSERSSNMAGKPVSLVDPVWKRDTTRSKLELIIVEGKGDMEGLGSEVSSAEIEQLIDFVLWLPADPVPADSISSSQ